MLYEVLNPTSPTDSRDILENDLPPINSKITVYPSISATFYAPSDNCGTGGMLKERVRSSSSWHKQGARRDCVFVEKDPRLRGFKGLHAARVLLFFSFTHNKIIYPCALVWWYSPIDSVPCELTGMWIVEPELTDEGRPSVGVIRVDSILRGAHLIPVFGEDELDKDLRHADSLDAFSHFYVSKFADHHSHEIAF
jgi:hypothetical protein